MPKRRYKSKWHRYGTLAGVLLTVIGSVFMILLGVVALLDQTAPRYLLLSNIISISPEFDILWGVVTIVCGIAILVVTVHQKPHEEDTIVWMILAAILAILGGTLGGLITFGGALIYLLVYIL